MKDKQQAIGGLIKSRRKSLKVRQEHLADLAGVSIRTLRNIEKGDSNPELDTLLKVCYVLGMEIRIQVILPR